MANFSKIKSRGTVKDRRGYDPYRPSTKPVALKTKSVLQGLLEEASLNVPKAKKRKFFIGV